MRLLVTGSRPPDVQTFKRLLLVADEIGFMDYPSVVFDGKYGSIGRPSEVRQVSSDGSPVAITVHEPHSGPADDLYEPYALADLRSAAFRKAVFEAMSNDDFASRFIQPQAKYGNGHVSGAELRHDLLSDPNLSTYDVVEIDVGPAFYGEFGSDEARRALFKKTLLDTSVILTSTLDVAEQTGLAPVSDDATLCNLLAIRMVDRQYVGDTPATAAPLGIAVMAALIPDDVVAKLSIAELLAYRTESKDAYEAWTTEINRLAVRITDISPDALAKALPEIIHGEFRPKLLEYRAEAKAASERMFGDLLKAAIGLPVPTLSVAYFATLTVPQALAVFAALYAPVVIPATVDYFVARRSLQRTNAAAYLIGVKDKADDI